MRLFLAVFLVCASLASAQSGAKPEAPATKKPASPSDAKTESKTPAKAETKTEDKQPKPADVPMNAAVITLTGACRDQGSTPQTGELGCKNVITRAEFEKLVDAFNPNMPAGVKRTLGENLGRLLIVSNEAVKRGVQNDPRTQELFYFAKLQVLAQQLGRRMQEEYSKVPDADIQQYYQKNLRKYEEAKLLRIIVPRSTAPGAKTDVASKGTSTDKTATEGEDKAYADKVRQRWAAGEDATKLQEEAFKRVKIEAPAPGVDVGDRRRGTLPTTQESVFDLKAGDVSQIYEDPSAYYIFKVQSKRTAPVPEVKDEIEKILAGERLQAEFERVNGSAVPSLNNNYFVAASQGEGGEREELEGRRAPEKEPAPKK